MSRYYSMSECAADVSVTRDDFFRSLLKHSLYPNRATRSRGLRVVSLDPAKSNLSAWVFTCDKSFEDHKSCKTFETLNKHLLRSEYFTPNGFYNRCRREKRFLRHLNAIFVDIDYVIDPLEVKDLVSFNRLPSPSVVANTPGGGCHVYWLLDKPVPATPKAVAFYESLQRSLALVLGGDLRAVGAERYMRIPRPDLNHFWDLGKRYTLQDFYDWRELYMPQSFGSQSCDCFSKDHPGVSLLLEGVEEGRRNSTAFALGLHFKINNMSLEWTLDRLTRWNSLNHPPLTSHELTYTIERVYRIERYNIYPARVLSLLSGERMRWKIRTPRRPRADRVRVHYSERVEDIHGLLAKQKRKTLVTSTRKLAAILGANPGVVHAVIKKMEEDYKKTFKVYIVGKGRRMRTVIKLIGSSELPVPDKNIGPPEEFSDAFTSGVHVSSGGRVGIFFCSNPLVSGAMKDDEGG